GPGPPLAVLSGGEPSGGGRVPPPDAPAIPRRGHRRARRLAGRRGSPLSLERRLLRATPARGMSQSLPRGGARQLRRVHRVDPGVSGKPVHRGPTFDARDVSEGAL